MDALISALFEARWGLLLAVFCGLAWWTLSFPNE